MTTTTQHTTKLGQILAIGLKHSLRRPSFMRMALAHSVKHPNLAISECAQAVRDLYIKENQKITEDCDREIALLAAL